MVEIGAVAGLAPVSSDCSAVLFIDDHRKVVAGQVSLLAVCARLWYCNHLTGPTERHCFARLIRAAATPLDYHSH